MLGIRSFLPSMVRRIGEEGAGMSLSDGTGFRGSFLRTSEEVFFGGAYRCCLLDFEGNWLERMGGYRCLLGVSGVKRRLSCLFGE